MDVDRIDGSTWWTGKTNGCRTMWMIIRMSLYHRNFTITYESHLWLNGFYFYCLNFCTTRSTSVGKEVLIKFWLVLCARSSWELDVTVSRSKTFAACNLSYFLSIFIVRLKPSVFKGQLFHQKSSCKKCLGCNWKKMTWYRLWTREYHTNVFLFYFIEKLQKISCLQII